jgi:hypothetical protein
MNKKHVLKKLTKGLKFSYHKINFKHKSEHEDEIIETGFHTIKVYFKLIKIMKTIDGVMLGICIKMKLWDERNGIGF